MNPLGVLTARDAMRPLANAPHPAPEYTVTADTPIQHVMSRVCTAEAPVGVTEGGQLVGEVTRDTVLERLLDPTGGRTG